MATYNFIKPTATGSLPATVSVSDASLPALSKGTPLAVYMQPTKLAPYPAADITSYTTTTIAPSYSSMKSFTYTTNANRFHFGGVLADTGGYGFNTINSATGGSGVSGWSFEVYLTGTDVTFDCYSYGNTDYKVIVDDMPMTLNWQHFSSTAGSAYIKIQFATSRTRKIRVILGQTGFARALTPGSGDIWPAGPRFKVAVIGNSFVQGAGANSEGTISAGTIAGELAVRTGWEVWNMGEGGTGYQNPGNATTTSPGPSGVDYYGSTVRMNALAALPTMDMIMVWGGANDGDTNTYAVATSVTRANTLWSAIKTARPTTPLVVAGVESGVYPASRTGLDTLNTALASAASTNAAVAGYINQRSPTMWTDGTGYITTPTGNGNADIFVASDQVHPTHAGWGYATARLVTELKKVRV